MTNAQLFPYPEFNLKLNKYLIDLNAIPDIEGQVKVTWESLLSKDNKELTTILPLENAKLAAFVEKTKEEFKENYSDLRKFPKMNDDDWK